MVISQPSICLIADLFGCLIACLVELNMFDIMCVCVCASDRANDTRRNMVTPKDRPNNCAIA